MQYPKGAFTNYVYKIWLFLTTYPPPLVNVVCERPFIISACLLKIGKSSSHSFQLGKDCCPKFSNSFVPQLISKPNSTVFIWTKKRTKLFIISALKSEDILLQNSTFMSSSPTQGDISFLKYDLKWIFPDILILSITEFDTYRTLFIFWDGKVILSGAN